MRARGGFALGLFLALLGLSRAANQASSSAAISPNELLSILAYMQKTSNRVENATAEQLGQVRFDGKNTGYEEPLVVQQIHRCDLSVKPATILASFSHDGVGQAGRHLRPSAQKAAVTQTASSLPWLSVQGTPSKGKLLTVVTGPGASGLAHTYVSLARKVELLRRATALRGSPSDSAGPVSLALISPSTECLLAAEAVSELYRAGKIPQYTITLPADLQSERGMLCSEYRDTKHGDHDVLVCVKRTVEHGVVPGVISNTGSVGLCGATLSLLVPSDWELDGAAQVVKQLDLEVSPGVSATFEIPLPTTEANATGLYGLTVDPNFGDKCDSTRRRRRLQSSGGSSEPKPKTLSRLSERPDIPRMLVGYTPAILEKQAKKVMKKIKKTIRGMVGRG